MAKKKVIDPQQLRVTRVSKSLADCDTACERVRAWTSCGSQEATALTPCQQAQLRRKLAQLALSDAYLMLAATYSVIADLSMYLDAAQQVEMELCVV